MTRLVKVTCDIKAQFIFFSAELEFTKKVNFLREKRNIETHAKYCQKKILKEKLIHRQVVS